MSTQRTLKFDLDTACASMQALQKITDQQVAMAEHATELREVYANKGVPVKAVEAAWAVATRRRKAGVSDADWQALVRAANQLLTPEDNRHGTD